MSTTDPLGIPQIEDKRTKPSGLLPKNAQNWALVILTLVLVLIILFSGRNESKHAPKDPPPPPTSDPNPMKIDDVRRRIEDMANKNRIKQEDISGLQHAIATQATQAPGEQRYATTAAPTTYGGRAYLDPNPPRAWVDTEEEKRESRAPFASNIAFSNRKDDPLSAKELELAALAAKLGDASNRLPSSGSGPPQRPDQRPDANRNEEEQTASEKPRKARPSHPHRPGEIDYPLFEGSVLETVLTNRLDGYFSGPINCMVTTDIYSPNGAYILIPKGSRVLGEVRRVDTFGQRRLAVVFHRLIMPDGYSVLLDQFKGLNQIGETGLRDRVNNHYLQLFSVSIAIGAIAGLAQSNTHYGADVTGTQVYEQGVANSLSQTSLHILDRYLNVLPTFTIREGHRIKIYLTQDLLLPAYNKHVAEAEPEAQPVADIVATNGRGEEE
jgi:type IV secretory pathway VirB10-like protein